MKLSRPQLDVTAERKPAQETSSAGERASAVLTAPNALTAFRIVLTLPFLYLVSKGRFGFALLVFSVASLTDFLDGYLARKLNQKSSLGRFLDPLADKLLTTVTYVVLALPHEGFPSIPAWLAIAVVARDAVILAGSSVVYLMTGFRSFTPTLLGKINTFMELGLVVWFLVFHTTGSFTYFLPPMYVAVLLTVILSGFDYAYRGFVIAFRPRS